MNTTDMINDAIETLITKVNSMRNEYFITHYSHAPLESIGRTEGVRYVKLVVAREGQVRSVYGFVDRNTGEVYKAASFKAPAKHSRGNVLDPDNGMSACTVHGIVYLR